MNPLFFILIVLSFFGMPIVALDSASAISDIQTHKNEQVLGVASRLSDKHFDERSFQQKIDTYVGRVHTKFDQWKPAEHEKEIKHVGAWVLNRVERISSQIPLDVLTRSVSELLHVLDRVESNGGKSIVVPRFQPIKSALAVKIAAGLCYHSRKKLLSVLDSIHEHIAYWRYQDAHQFYYLTHKSPLKWFSRDAQKQEIVQHIRLLEGARREHFRVLGQLISACKGFDDDGASVDSLNDEQALWAADVIRIVQSMCGRPSLLQHKIKSYESLINAARDVAPALMNHRETIDAVIRRAKKPNHFVRHWMPYTAAIAGIGATVWYLHKNPGQISEAASRIKLAAINNYNSYLKAPVEKVGGALGLWDKGGDATSEFVETQVQRLRDGIDQVKANIPEGKPKVSKEVQTSYAKLLTDFQEWNNQQAGFGYLSTAADFDKLDLGNIQAASEILSGDVLDKALDHFLADWKKASLTQKPELVSHLASFAKVTKDVAAFRGGNVLDGVAKAIGAIEEMIIVNIRQLDEVRTLIKLPIALLALVSAGKLAQVGYTGVKKAGGMLLPSPYDDAPIKDAILGARDLMDDCKYLDGTPDMSDIQVGKLFYHLNRIGQEVKNVSPEHRKALLKYLRRTQITDSIDGKRVYLKKMYQEYKEWHKATNIA